jgi:GntR family transcriptional regulator, transcriptional repressor for pyruvate dehydrogenase complex
MESSSSISSLSPVTRKPLYEKLVEHLRAYVIEADLSAGDRLPPERELAERLGVSRASVRQAIVALEVQGIVEVRHGEGAFLRTARMETVPITQLAELKRRLPDLLDARQAIEVKLAELAAERRTDSDLATADAALEKMEQEIKAGSTGEVGDHEFHQSVVDAAHSELLAHMYALLRGDIELSSHETVDQIGTPATLLEQNRRIADAIRASDARGAANAMQAHLATVGQLKLMAWSPLPD